jgi:hypothetical protein
MAVRVVGHDESTAGELRPREIVAAFARFGLATDANEHAAIFPELGFHWTASVASAPTPADRYNPNITTAR